MKTNGHKIQPRTPPSERIHLARRKLARFKRLLRQHLPELQARYRVKSLGVFGSYVRGDARPRSDLDLLVELDNTRSLFDFVALQNDLTDLLGVKVDLVPRENLKPFIGQRILSEVEWLSQEGKLIDGKPARPINRPKGGARMTPKREYLDYLNDIVHTMEQAERFIQGVSFDELVKDEMRVAACAKAIEDIGEAAKHIPADVRRRYPEIPWKEMAGTRDHIAHGYFSLDLPRIWTIATDLIPRAKPLVADALEKELARRRA